MVTVIDGEGRMRYADKSGGSVDTGRKPRVEDEACEDWLNRSALAEQVSRRMLKGGA